MVKADVFKNIQSLLTGQKLGILATLGRVYPYQSIVAFTATEDMQYLLFATKRTTSKYKNMKRKARVCIFIDNRSNLDLDFNDTKGLTALGDVRDLHGASRTQYTKLFLRKHPHLKDFLATPDCALCMIKVRSYSLVTHFQEVIEVRMP